MSQMRWVTHMTGVAYILFVFGATERWVWGLESLNTLIQLFDCLGVFLQLWRIALAKYVPESCTKSGEAKVLAIAIAMRELCKSLMLKLEKQPLDASECQMPLGAWRDGFALFVSPYQ